MRVSIGSDHAGFEQKQALVDYLVGKGYDVIDRGPDNDDRVDYPDYAAPVAHDVADGVAERGVLVCGTGIGMAMAADKVPGVRAANIINSEFAALCREHNDANVLNLSGRFVPGKGTGCACLRGPWPCRPCVWTGVPAFCSGSKRGAAGFVVSCRHRAGKKITFERQG